MSDTKVRLPDGCYGLQMASDGREFNGRPGSTISVPDRYEQEIRQSGAGTRGVVRFGQTYNLGTKRGRWCPPCHFMAQAWSETCPRCGRPTQEVNPDDTVAQVGSA